MHLITSDISSNTQWFQYPLYDFTYHFSVLFGRLFKPMHIRIFTQQIRFSGHSLDYLVFVMEKGGCTLRWEISYYIIKFKLKKCTFAFR